jgi:hypothetical protein
MSSIGIDLDIKLDMDLGDAAKAGPSPPSILTVCPQL